MENTMKSKSQFRIHVSNEAILSADIMAMAASLADEVAEKWPFMAARLRMDVFGAVGHSDLSTAIGKAVTLGLSGIVDSAAEPRKTAGIFTLQQRMMAVRLVGRKLVAFHPDRDLTFILTRRGGLIDRVRLRVWSADGALVGQAERMAGSASSHSRIERAACA